MREIDKVLWESAYHNKDGVPYLTVKQAEGHNYVYTERAGKDSVAFILYDRETNLYGLINEYKPPIHQHLVTAYGGSIEKEFDGKLRELVVQEVREEAGFIITKEKVHPYGSVFVSTQMNQKCELFLVDVTGLTPQERQPENAIEAMAEPVWVAQHDLINGPCWKAITIFMRTL